LACGPQAGGRRGAVTVPTVSAVSGGDPALRPDGQRSRRLRREASVVAVGQAGAALVGLGGLRLLTTLLSPEEFGRLALGLSITAFLQQVAFGPVSAATLRYAGNAAKENDLDAFLDSLRRLLRQAVLLSVVVATVGVLVLLALGLQAWIALALSAVWFAAASGTSTALLFVDASLRRRPWVAGVQIVGEVLRFGLAGAALVILDIRSATLTMSGFALALTLVALLQLRRWQHGQRSIATRTDPWRTSMVLFAAPLALTGALSWSQLASDRWSLNAFLSVVHVGAYSVLYQIAVAPFSLLSVMLQQLIGPIVFRMAGRGTDEDALRASHRVVVLAIVGLLGCTVVGALVAWEFHEWIFAALVGPRFRNFSPLLPLAVCVGGVLAASQLAGTTVMSRGDTTRLITPKVVTSIIGVGLNILGARYYGVTGVLCANGVFGILFFVWMLVLARKPRRAAPFAPDGI